MVSSVKSDTAIPFFTSRLIDWQKQHGRHGLPWQNTRDPYRIWLSEIMLQQTQVATVIPYYDRFLTSFPSVQALAAAPSEAVMAHWSGLGYYSRARNLHRCAQQVVNEFGGIFPDDPVQLAELPGIGRSTAAAIAAFAYGRRAAILDGNVKRVLTRVFGIEGYPGTRAVETLLWQRAEMLLPKQHIEAYTQGLMDLGATLCMRNKPACPDCPMAAQCVALATGRTHELPTRKTKTANPEKRIAMLVIVDGDSVLLQQRPNYGIWGGLLSLPEIDAVDWPDRDVFTKALGVIGELDIWESLPPFSHGFTHFKLHVTPYRVTLKRRSSPLAQTNYVWLEKEKLAQAPLPAPIKKLLAKVA